MLATLAMVSLYLIGVEPNGNMEAKVREHLLNTVLSKIILYKG